MTSIRDLTCIYSVAHMAEYGKYEEEFIVYGCAYLEEEKILYCISADYDEMAQFIKGCAFKNTHPTPVHSIMRRHIVQTGQRERLLYQTQLQLANLLQEMYPRLFFDQVKKCSAAAATDAARPTFDQLRFALEGVFSADYLQLFDGLAEVAYRAKLLTDDALFEIQQWRKKMNRQMEQEIVVKKPFHRTFYGFCFLDQNQIPHYKVNTQAFSVVNAQREMKRSKYCVTPVFQKTYWYDYGVAPKAIKEEFQALLASYYTEEYWAYWKQIRQCPAVVQSAQFEEALALIASSCRPEALWALQEYGYDWNIDG